MTVAAGYLYSRVGSNGVPASGVSLSEEEKLNMFAVEGKGSSLSFSTMGLLEGELGNSRSVRYQRRQPALVEIKLYAASNGAKFYVTILELLAEEDSRLDESDLRYPDLSKVRAPSERVIRLQMTKTQWASPREPAD